jgi:Sushi repeat (SCR repeat)
MLNINYAVIHNKRVVFTTTVRVTCWPGYALNATTESVDIVCNASGMWSDNPVCHRKFQ